MSLEEQRKANIARNASMMKQFKLQEANNATFSDGKVKKQSKTNSKPRPKREPDVPREGQRKSRRLQGIKIKTEEEDDAKLVTASEKSAQPYNNARREGELQLKQLITDGKLDQTLEIIQQFGDSKASISDYFESIEPNNKVVKDLRDEFEKLDVSPRTVKITDQRVHCITMHPANDKRLVAAGDKVGQLGLWDADLEEDEGLIQFDAHTRAISMLHFNLQDPLKLYSSAYDGSIRILDLKAQKSVETFVYGEPTNPVGISDFELVDSRIYYTTLEGDFGILDERANKVVKELDLSEKKIGGFSVNPKDRNFIATASLDRTMKVWDLRNAKEPMAVYNSSLSISSTSWNTDDQIVCNGYDNTINIFDQGHKLAGELKPSVRLKHNCQTGRWVTILKSRWQQNPHDGIAKFAIGDMSRYIDIFTGDGQQVARLGNEVTAVPAAVAMHREQNWVVGGNASGKAYLYTN